VGTEGLETLSAADYRGRAPGRRKGEAIRSQSRQRFGGSLADIVRSINLLTYFTYLSQNQQLTNAF